jgi:ABC-2 type transport system permease protein
MGVDVGIGVLLARRQGLWSRLLAAPITVTTVLMARALSCALIAFGLLCFIFAVAGLLFGVRITGSTLGFLGVGLCFALVTATFGLLIAAFGKTPEAARGLAVFATLIMVMLGGAWVPAFLFPQWLQTATLVMPTRWAVDGFDAMTWRGLGIEVALQAMAVQLGYALLFGVLAMRKFGRDERQT